MLTPDDLDKAWFVAAVAVASLRVRNRDDAAVRVGALALAAGWVEAHVPDAAEQESWWVALERAVDAEVSETRRPTVALAPPREDASRETAGTGLLLAVAAAVAAGRRAGLPETSIRREALARASEDAGRVFPDPVIRVAILWTAEVVIERALEATR